MAFARFKKAVGGINRPSNIGYQSMTVGTSYIPMTNPSPGPYIFTAVDVGTKNTNPISQNAEIQILSDGLYAACFHVTFTDSVGTAFEFAAFKNGALLAKCFTEGQIAVGASDKKAGGYFCKDRFLAGDSVVMRVFANSPGSTLQVRFTHFHMEKADELV